VTGSTGYRFARWVETGETGEEERVARSLAIYTALFNCSESDLTVSSPSFNYQTATEKVRKERNNKVIKSS